MSAIALIAIALTVVNLQLGSRLTMRLGAASAVGIAVVLAGALLVGGSLTQPPTASAANTDPKVIGAGRAGSKLDGIRLPTLSAD